ncbi:MAG: DUF1295 domain-containing protein [Bacilli bacterium]|jgi:steroid 5-alpha reductase family enzyme
MSIWQFVIPLAVILVYFTVLYFVAEAKRNYGLVDIGWGAGFVIVAIVSAILQLVFHGFLSVTAIAVLAVTTFWGLRLSWHILKRNRGRSEDFRYVAMRERYAKRKHPKLAAYARIFLTQAFFMIVIGLVVVLGIGQTRLASDFWHYALIGLGLLIWIFGFVFESVGDAQLARFLKDPSNKGKIMDRGLWRYTRHPNYFGEATMWVGVGVMALSVAWGFLGLISPLTITWLLVFVSGIPLLEKAMMKRPEFVEYARKTSIFVPWFPKK